MTNPPNFIASFPGSLAAFGDEGVGEASRGGGTVSSRTREQSPFHIRRPGGWGKGVDVENPSEAFDLSVEGVESGEDMVLHLQSRHPQIPPREEESLVHVVQCL